MYLSFVYLKKSRDLKGIALSLPVHTQYLVGQRFASSKSRLSNESAANYSKWKNLGRSKVELVCLHASLTRNRFVRAKINGRCARKRRPALPSWNGRSIEPITELSSVAGGVCRFPRQMNVLQSSVHGTSSSAGFERMNVALHADSFFHNVFDHAYSTNTKGTRFFQRFFGYSGNNIETSIRIIDSLDFVLLRIFPIVFSLETLRYSERFDSCACHEASSNILLANRTQGEKKMRERGRVFRAATG